MCMTTDLVVRAAPPRAFEALLARPENREIAVAIAAPLAPPENTLVEDPNLRILGLSPRGMLHVCILALAAFAAIGGTILWRMAMKDKRE